MPQTSYLQKSNDYKVSSDVSNKESLLEEKRGNVNPIADKSERSSRKQKAVCEPLAARKRTENESRVSKCFTNWVFELLF